MRKKVALRANAVVASAFGAFASFQAAAQTPPPLDSVPEKVAPDAKPTEPATNLSQKLDQSDGVIKPKDVDPGIEKPVPNTHTDDTIKPPGTPGGAPAPEAK